MAFAQPAAQQPVPPSAGPAAPPVAPPWTAPIELAPDAPDQYVVVRGDTLWAIAGRFLQKPWRWPEIWQLNREQIRNPHLIYPGDIVYLDRLGESPRLRLARALARGDGSQGAYAPVERYDPRVRSRELPPAPIPTVDLASIAPFLIQPLVVDEAGLRNHPRIVATQEGRVNATVGDRAYVLGMGEDPQKDWFVYRPARPILDPDTRKPIAWQAVRIGFASVDRAGNPATIRIVSATEEIETGARLMPSEREPQPNWVPHAPESQVAGRIVSVARNIEQVGKYGTVAVNLGASAGLEPGHVLAIYRRPRVVTDRETREAVQLPAEPIGHLLLFRVFDKIGYGLVMASSRAVEIGDNVTNP